MSKVCIFFAEGFEEVEALAVSDIMRRAKVETVLVSVTGDRTVTSSRGVKVVTDQLYGEMDFSEVDMLVLPGGIPGMPNLSACQPLMDLVKEFDQDGKYIAAICASPSIFGKLGLLKGKRATSNPDFMDQLEGAVLTTEEVAADGNIITSRGMGTSIPFALKLVSILKGAEISEDVKKAIVYEH